MAEFIGVGETEVQLTIKISLDYEEFYLTQEAARELRDELNSILNRV